MNLQEAVKRYDTPILLRREDSRYSYVVTENAKGDLIARVKDQSDTVLPIAWPAPILFTPKYEVEVVLDQ